MNQSEQWDDEAPPTLDPPGTIAVVGAGPLGIEAALYGRFLGYDVTLVEAHEVCHALRDKTDISLPILPDRCLSPLAMGALTAQDPESAVRTLPLSVSQWMEEVMIPLTESDLLRGRVCVPWTVSKIDLVPIELDEEYEESDAIPPDFRLTIVGADGHAESMDAEAVILAVGQRSSIELGFSLPTPYFFRIGATVSDDWEESLWAGYREIVDVYAQLAGRAGLDLYRPKRS